MRSLGIQQRSSSCSLVFAEEHVTLGGILRFQNRSFTSGLPLEISACVYLFRSSWELWEDFVLDKVKHKLSAGEHGNMLSLDGEGL